MEANEQPRIKKITRMHSSSSNFVGSVVRSFEYDAAGDGHRSRNWGTSNAGPNASLNGNLEKLRRRSRHECRTNTWAASSVETIVSNVVGSGIKPMHKNAEILKAWRKWSKECDAYFYTSFEGLQTLIIRSVVESGEVFVRLRPRKASDGLFVPLQLQVIEAEHVPSTLNKELPNGNRIVAGIEFNKIGRPVAYHMLPQHPGEGLGALSEPVRVPAAGVLHIRMMRRPGEVRGEPWLARGLVKLRDLDAYDDAELVRKKAAALHGGFIYTPGAEDDDAMVARITGQDTGQEEDIYIEPLEPGSFPVLPPGYDVKFSQPADVGGSYEVFMRSQLRSIAASVGITYEQLTGDFANVNDRLVRASLLEFKRRARMWQQQLLIHQFCVPVWQRFMELATLTEALSSREAGVDEAPEWIAEAWEYLNPGQEIDAAAKEVQAGFKSRSEVISQRGRDPETVDMQIAKDNERADNLGLTHSSDGRTRSLSHSSDGRYSFFDELKLTENKDLDND